MQPAEADKIKAFLRARLNLSAVEGKDAVLERVIQSVQICEKFFKGRIGTIFPFLKGRFVCACIIGSALSENKPPGDIDILCFIRDLNEERDRNLLGEYVSRQSKGNEIFVYDEEPPKDSKNPLVQITVVPAPNLNHAGEILADLLYKKHLHPDDKIKFFKMLVFERFIGDLLFFYGNRKYFSELVEIVLGALRFLLNVAPENLDVKSNAHHPFIEVNLTEHVRKARDLIL